MIYILGINAYHGGFSGWLFGAAYISGSAFVLGTTIWIILQMQGRSINGWLVGWLVAIPFSILAMIKLRCTIDAYPCGFMSLTGGFTWHFIPGLTGFVMVWALSSIVLNTFRGIGWLVWMEYLGRSMVPLLGLWIALLWEILPVSLIHPPSYGGPCPFLPIICHDVPMMGHGGLFYWTTPFALWAGVEIIRKCRRLLELTSL